MIVKTYHTNELFGMIATMGDFRRRVHSYVEHYHLLELPNPEIELSRIKIRYALKEYLEYINGNLYSPEELLKKSYSSKTLEDASRSGIREIANTIPLCYIDDILKVHPEYHVNDITRELVYQHQYTFNPKAVQGFLVTWFSLFQGKYYIERRGIDGTPMREICQIDPCRF